MYYGSRKPSQKVQALRKKQGEHRLFFLGAVIMTGILGLASFICIVRMPVFRINQVSVTGTEIVSAETVQKEILSELTGNTAFVLPKSSVLVYPRKKILEKIIHDFPRLDNSTLTAATLHALTFSANERAGTYLWCGTTFSNTANCIYIDKNGYLFADAPSFSGTIYLKFFGPLPNTDTPLGTQLMPSEDFHALVLFADGLEHIGLSSHAVILKNDTYEFLISNPPSETTGRIIVPKSDTLEVGLHNLDAAVHVDPLQTKLAENREGLLYIDLRFNKKVYYKFTDRNAEKETNGTDEN
jgi:hypothetical protein